ncbi:hypothetical protein SESBI_18573, partial [Sesbania bispinosa]
MERTESTQPETTTQSAATTNQNTPANPNLKEASANSGIEDLHGDWISVSKPRRGKKSRDWESIIKGKEGISKKGNNDDGGKNRFAALQKAENKDKGVKVASGSYKVADQAPLFTSGQSQPKVWSRKKRQRQEPSFGPIKIFPDEKYKVFLEARNKDGNQREEPVRGKESAIEAKAQPSSSGAPTGVHHLEGNIRTTMDVEVIGPNRLRFIDEPEPPDIGNGPVLGNSLGDKGTIVLDKAGDTHLVDVALEEPHEGTSTMH